MSLNIITCLPANVFAAAGDSHVYEKDGYTVTYKIGNEWDNNRSVTVTLKNTGEESILNWALKYDVGGELYNLWNSTVYDSGEDGTIIKNNGYNYEIEPGQSVDYGYIVTGEETLIPEDIELCSRRIDVKSGYEVDFNITNDWYTGFQAEMSIENTSNEPIEAWTLLFEGNFDIVDIWNAKLLSSEDRSYEVANQLWTTPIKAGESASFGFTANKSATENAKAENFQLTAVIIGESVFEYPDLDDIDFELDTDEDGLPDYYEDILGTDKNKADSDGDGLLDGYEYFTLGTDPLKKDTDDNGVSDANEDFDEDELTNIEEYELGTDPFSKDTDYDGLSDYDEVKIHNTDPLKYDTDGDNVSDGDEAELGLNPLNPATNGYPDNEYTTEQSLGTDSTVFDYINTVENNPYTISVDFTAAGVAENNLSVGESGYSSAIENSAIIGIAPEFVYRDGLSVEEVTIKFNLENSVINNTLGTYAENNDGFKGIKRLNIFTFIEGINMLLPVETFYDEVANTVYTKTDKMGTYCLIDMEIFFQNLGIEPSGTVEVEVSEAMSGNMLDSEGYLRCSVSENAAKADNPYIGPIYKDNFDVVFIIDTVHCNIKDYEDEILKTAQVIWGVSPNVKITVYNIKDTNGAYYKKSKSCQRISELRRVIAGFDTLYKVPMVNMSKAVDDIINNYKGKTIYCFAFFNSHACDYQNIYNSKGMLYGIKYGAKNVNISVVSDIDEQYKEANTFDAMTYAVALYKMTNGIDIPAEEFSEKALEHIYGEIPDIRSVPYQYQAIIATGYEPVVLKSVLTSQDLENAKKYSEEPNHTFNADEIKGCSDTDEDGLWDFQEVMFFLDGNQIIEISDYNLLRLPTVGEIVGEKESDIAEYFKEYTSVPYVESGWKDAKERYGEEYDEYLTYDVLPIYSDPTDADGDNDGIPDYCDLNQLHINSSKIDLDQSCAKLTETFAVINTFTTPFPVCQNINNNVNVYSLPFLSSSILFDYDSGSNCDLIIYSVIKWQENYWIKIRDSYSKKSGYIQWSTGLFNNADVKIQNAINNYNNQTTELILSYDDLREALESSGCLKGETVESKLSKTSYESISYFTGDWRKGVVESKYTYIDDNKLLRAKMFDENGSSDYYAVAISDELRQRLFKALYKIKSNKISNDDYHYGGIKFKIKLVGEHNEVYYLNMLCADTKSDVKFFSPELGENKLFPISRNRDNSIRYSDDDSIEYHDHLLEFAVDVRPSKSISTGGNVDFDKLCGVPKGTNLRVDEVYVYFFNPLVSYDTATRNYIDFSDLEENHNEGK